MPTNFFADLVREASSATGTGDLALTGAVPGHRRFADVVPPGATFFYAIAGVAMPDQWETGKGSLTSGGAIQRDLVIASSNAGARVDFGPGLKTVALTVGSGWFADQQSGLAAVEVAVAERQPISTGHGPAAMGEASDTVTIRRGSGWLNLPLGALLRRAASGRFGADAPLDVPAGSASEAALAIGGETGLGPFRPGPGTLGFASGGAERMRITSDGKLVLGGTAGVGQIDAVNPSGRVGFNAGPIASPNRGNLYYDTDGSGWKFNIGKWQSSTFTAQMTFQDNGNVGIGTAAPAVNFEISAVDPQLRIRQTVSNAVPFGLELGAGGFVDAAFKSLLTTGEVRVSAGRNSSWGGFFTFYTDTVERLRITSAGNVGIGTTAPTQKLTLRDAAWPLVKLEKAGVGDWELGVKSSNDFAISVNGSPYVSCVLAGGLYPTAGDNSLTLGSGALRWSTVYAATGTINTSDAREKTWRGELNEAELRAASRIAREIGVFQWNDAVAAKGADKARLHVGVRAQAVWAIMAEEGLVDPVRKNGKPGATPYAFLCWDRWEAEGERGDRFGVRVDQLALFIAAAQEQRLAKLETAA